jgi:hypothetical protein
MNDMFLNLWKTMCQRTINSDDYMTNLGWFLIVTFPVFYIINKFMFELDS